MPFTPRREKLLAKNRIKQTRITQYLSSAVASSPPKRRRDESQLFLHPESDSSLMRRHILLHPSTSSGFRCKPPTCVMSEPSLLSPNLFSWYAFTHHHGWSIDALVNYLSTRPSVIISGFGALIANVVEIERQMKEIDDAISVTENSLMNSHTSTNGYETVGLLYSNTAVQCVDHVADVDDSGFIQPSNDAACDDDPSFEPLQWSTNHGVYASDETVPDCRALPIRILDRYVNADSGTSLITPQRGRELAKRELVSAITPKIRNPRRISSIKQSLGQKEVAANKIMCSYMEQKWPKDCRYFGANRIHAQAYLDASAFVASLQYSRIHASDVFFDVNPPYLRPKQTRSCHSRHGIQDCYRGCASISHNHQVDYYDSGLFGDATCKFCDALLLTSEIYDNRITKCCADGAVHTCETQFEYNELQHPPAIFLTALVANVQKHVREQFLSNTRTLNNNFAFASTHAEKAPPGELGSRMDTCKYNGDFAFLFYDLEPPIGCTPKFAQLYTLDPDEAIKERTQNVAMIHQIDSGIIESLEFILRQSPLGRVFTTVAQKVEEVKSHNKIPFFRIILLTEREVREEEMAHYANFTVVERTDAPSAKQVAVVWVSDDGEPPEMPGVWICDHAGRERPLWNNSPQLEPACFPLLRIRGTPGWRLFLRKQKTITNAPNTVDGMVIADSNTSNDNEESAVFATSESRDDEYWQSDINEEVTDVSKLHFVDGTQNQEETTEVRKGSYDNISQRQYIRYQMQLRSGGKNDFHWLWYARKLAEYYTISSLNRMERNELEYLKKEQRKRNLRQILSRDYITALEKGLLKKHGGKLGQVFLMPCTFPGSKQYYTAKYGNLMTIVQHCGNPTWFITFTGNPEWPELLASLGEGQSWEHRPDLVCRVFMSKAEAFIHDVTKRGVFGKVRAWCYSVEHQKRGMPHLHLLLFMDACCKIDSPEQVDTFVCARIPPLPLMEDTSHAADQQRRLWHLVTKHMLHSCHARHCLNEDGRCLKYFPKPFSDQTILSDERYTEYVRLHPQLEPDVFEELESDDSGPATDYHHYLNVRYRRFRPSLKQTKDWNQEGLTYVYKRLGQPETHLNDSHVISYNPFLLLKYGCHINVEYVFGKKACKYIFKYLLKGFEKGYVKVERAKDSPESGDQNVYNYDEIKTTFRVRYMTATEAFLRIYAFPIVKMSHQIFSLTLHDENGQTVVFDENHEEELQERITKDTQLTGFFKLCQSDEEARKMKYIEIPYCYTWNRTLRVWKRRKFAKDVNMDTTNMFVRLFTVTPKRHELLALRTLLMHVPGPTSFVNLRTVQSGSELHECTTFTEAAQMRGLLESDAMHVGAMQDACNNIMSLRRLRHYFAMLIYYAKPASSRDLFERFWEHMFPKPAVNVQQNSSQHPLSDAFRRNTILKDLEFFLRGMGSTCSMAGLDCAPLDYDHEAIEAEIEGEYLEDDFYGAGRSRHNPQKVALDFAARLNDDQRAIFDEIVASIRGPAARKCFDIQGYGGCGKTFLFNTLIRWCLAGKPYTEAHNLNPLSFHSLERSSVIVTASTGIAATLLIGGSTVHSAFYVPNTVNSSTAAKINNESVGANRFRQADLIMVDEESMLHNHVLMYVDRLLREICASDTPFGGKVIVIGGDRHQLPPVVKGGSRSETVRASIKHSKLFQNNFKTLRLSKNMRTNPGEIAFSEWLLRIGKGLDENDNLTGTVEIPPENVSSDLLSLIDYCFPVHVLEDPLNNLEQLCSSAILNPRNDEVLKLNDMILCRMKGNEHICESLDTPLVPDFAVTHGPFRADCNLETINAMTPTGLPPHKLRLKVGAPVMLIRNIDQRHGLCNGTRLQVIKVTDSNVICRIATGPKAGSDIVLPPVKFEYGQESGSRDIRFTRIQFPLRLCFSMTINKAQGQTLKRMGLALQHLQCFAHGQLYVALSRVTCQEGFRVFSTSYRIGDPLKILNVVWQELLDD